MAKKQTFAIENHVLVPQHEKLSSADKKKLLETYNITVKELPSIFLNDPAIQHLNAEVNDIIKITRNSPTAGESVFFRSVIND